MNQGLPHDIAGPLSFGVPPIYWLGLFLSLVVLLAVGLIVYRIVKRTTGLEKDEKDLSIYASSRMAARERLDLVKRMGSNSDGKDWSPDVSSNLQFGNSLSLRKLLGAHFDLPLEAATHPEAVAYLKSHKNIRKQKNLEAWIAFLSACNEACYGKEPVTLQHTEQSCEQLLVWVSQLEKKSAEVGLVETTAVQTKASKVKRA
jgi:hypothetical protein